MDYVFYLIGLPLPLRFDLLLLSSWLLHPDTLATVCSLNNPRAVLSEAPCFVLCPLSRMLLWICTWLTLWLPSNLGLIVTLLMKSTLSTLLQMKCQLVSHLAPHPSILDPFTFLKFSKILLFLNYCIIYSWYLFFIFSLYNSMHVNKWHACSIFSFVHWCSYA